ncbi:MULTISPECIES: hypothetical protein [unclassified Curtobacterium]|uniref:hypothetical protein n=1 Tax=unclassified Curtobacterium TaxID=257496 RepID=UPI0008DD7D22|nr:MULTISPECIES: hypothetical protein [unclassified Curtobacterium]MCT9621093.1 hypothetical protein [Curtobacterium sp. C2H10]OII28350.1 hypothetical protein BIV03_05770 [Curtobacterium sp. MCBA15_016]
MSALVSSPARIASSVGAPRPGLLFPILLLAVFVAGVLASSALDGALQLAAVGTFLLALLVVPAIHAVRSGADMSGFVLVPTVISATQNLYLLLVADDVAPSALQVIIILNFVDAVLLVAILAVCRPRASTAAVPDPVADSRTVLVRRSVLVIAGLLVFTALGLVLFRAEPVAAVASFRNLVTPMLFLLIGLLASTQTRVNRYLGALAVLGACTVLFGFFELSAPQFWERAGLRHLWEAKGLGIADVRPLPANFYSSEEFDGEIVRRMVSSFADPVNFGTFLFAAFTAAMLVRSRLVMLLTAVGAVMTVSKGFFLSVLILVALWAQVYAHPVVRVLSIIVVVGAGAGFYLFTLDNSSGSTAAHVGGFTAAFVELPGHPLGRGVGNVGVLAGLFDGGSESEVQESGVGVIIAQLGIPGILLYAVFFWSVIAHARHLADARLRLGALALILGFLANATFNEVALSPNSAAPYFVALGMILGTAKRRTLE